MKEYTIIAMLIIIIMCLCWALWKTTRKPSITFKDSVETPINNPDRNTEFKKWIFDDPNDPEFINSERYCVDKEFIGKNGKTMCHISPCNKK